MTLYRFKKKKHAHPAYTIIPNVKWSQAIQYENYWYFQSETEGWPKPIKYDENDFRYIDGKFFDKVVDEELIKKLNQLFQF